MNAMNKPMTPFAANPFIFVFSALLLVAVLAWFGWGMLDRMGLAEEQAGAVVTGKHYNAPGQTFRTVIAGGRAWTLTDTTSDTHVILLDVAKEPTVAIVSNDVYDALQPGDSVQVRMRRTRVSRRLEVIDVVR